MNDLAIIIKQLDKGVDIDNEKLCILLYADDIVLLAESENDLQSMLNVLNMWCTSNNMVVNHIKVMLYILDPNLLIELHSVLHVGNMI